MDTYYDGRTRLDLMPKKFINVQINVPNVQLNNNTKIIKCEYCNKIFNARSTKSEHKKRSCKLNPNINKNSEFIELKNKNIELEKKNEEIKLLLEKNSKTFNKVNNNIELSLDINKESSLEDIYNKSSILDINQELQLDINKCEFIDF